MASWGTGRRREPGGLSVSASTYHRTKEEDHEGTQRGPLCGGRRGCGGGGGGRGVGRGAGPGAGWGECEDGARDGEGVHDGEEGRGRRGPLDRRLVGPLAAAPAG